MGGGSHRNKKTSEGEKMRGVTSEQQKPAEVKKFTMEEIMGNEEILAKVTKAASVRIFAPSTLAAYKKWRGKYWFFLFLWLVKASSLWGLSLG